MTAPAARRPAVPRSVRNAAQVTPRDIPSGMSDEEWIERCRQGWSRPIPVELAIIDGVANGRKHESIAADLGIERQSVLTHLMRARNRVGARTNHQLVAMSVRNGWIN